MVRRTCTGLATVSIAALLLTSCSGAAGPDSDDGGRSAAAGVEEYCAHVVDLRTVTEDVWGDLREESSPGEVEAASQRLLEEGGAAIERFEESAPEEIAADVRAVFDELRALAATGESPDLDSAHAADERVQEFEEFEEDHCELVLDDVN